MKDNFKKYLDEMSKFYRKLRERCLLQGKRIFGVKVEMIRKPTTTTAIKTNNNTTTTATAGGCITQNAPRPPNKKSIVILKGIDSKKALFHGDSRKQLFFRRI